MKKKIIIIGNMGYVGTVLVKYLRQKYPNAFLIGLDLGIFSHCLSTNEQIPETKLDLQIFGDVKKVNSKILEGSDGIIYLAAISNDPMGNLYESLTTEINYNSCIRWAEASKKAGIKNFVFASSCSVYGAADDSPKKETDPLNPLTTYARSKINAENSLKILAEKSYQISCLRFATACGMSDRLRIDLVLNDFVFSALNTGKIDILSNGKPWRPLIDVYDMARSIDWALHRQGQEFLTVNVGSNDWNYQVLELAENVHSMIPNVEINLNKNAPVDNRSYRVDFSLYEKLAKNHKVNFTIQESIERLIRGIESLKTKKFSKYDFIRLNVLQNYLEKKNVV